MSSWFPSSYYDEDDVKPAVTTHWRRDYGYGYGYGGGVAGEDVKPRPGPPRAGAGAGRGVHGQDDRAALSWPAAEEFKSTLRTQESLAGLRTNDAAVACRLSQGQGVVDLKTYLSESNLVAAKISRAPACLGTGASQGAAPPTATGKKRKAAAPAGGGGGGGGDVLRSEPRAKEMALSKAKGEISQLKKELGNAKKRELAEAQQALAYAAQVLKPEGGGKGAGAGKRRRGAQ
ncbi:hypothetical protein TRIUR3_18996 [Triticum urartu]|uniref:Uncharacterized protein n=1 Tax=Triticum urartu TaxID=4572 RepID=M7ZSP7_TRIUA|nr:hypothetical protein TRIUR3_18996 [Triticum urartu]